MDDMHILFDFVEIRYTCSIGAKNQLVVDQNQVKTHGTRGGFGDEQSQTFTFRA